MDAPARFPRLPHFAATRKTYAGVLSPIESLTPAWGETTRLLFRPFELRRWAALSVLCLFLGGGTSTAAFQWGVGALPFDLRSTELWLRARMAIAQHLSLTVLAVVVSLTAVLGFIYARCVFRFALIEAVIKHDVDVRAAWKRLSRLGRSYFFWLVGVVGVVLALSAGVMITSFYYLNRWRAAGDPWWVASVVLVLELIAVVLIGLLVAIVITLTDDLAAPLMYADQVSLPTAWRVLWKIWRRDADTFLFYIVLRMAVSMGISIAVLFVLFPLLMGLSSGALVAASAVIFAMRILGLAWAWNPLTIILGALALGILTLLLFALLSVVGMPGQVYLQNYGVQFIGSRVPSLGAICRISPSWSRRR